MTLDARKAHDGRIENQANEVAIYPLKEPFWCLCLQLYTNSSTVTRQINGRCRVPTAKSRYAFIRDTRELNWWPVPIAHSSENSFSRIPRDLGEVACLKVQTP
jgi:lysozyme family protein